VTGLDAVRRVSDVANRYFVVWVLAASGPALASYFSRGASAASGDGTAAPTGSSDD
jgi:hypothetical protein